ncbi:MAG: hypothetical protein E4H41_09260 [Gemmatimonadales bacterium]|nr:MAG: hypothetical protein E4H41_09260 [Gemmatimonadales bacterium]
MDRLKEPDRSEALLLLGESLQEQGRLAESVPYLESVSASASVAVRSRSNVLRLYGRSFGDADSRDDTDGALELLLSEARNAAETNTRLRALWMAARLCRGRGDLEMVHQIEARIRSEDFGAMSIEDKGEHALGIAYCQYLAGEKRLGRMTIQSIMDELKANGIVNSVYLSLLSGLGVMKGDLGDYEGETRVLEEGLQIARQIGDELRYQQICGNLAYIHGKLGNIQEQIRWASVATSFTGPETSVFTHHQIHLQKARAYALQGCEAESLCALADGRLTGQKRIPSYLEQAWHLGAADVYVILGRSSDALREARSAVASDANVLESDKFAGPYARWSARVAVNDGTGVQETLARLATLRDRERLLDRIDQFEVLNAKVWLDSRTGVVSEEERTEMWRRLAALPAGAVNEFRKLGMLDID